MARGPGGGSVGAGVTTGVGTGVGIADGSADGGTDASEVGAGVGGAADGTSDDSGVGAGVGSGVGTGVGSGVGTGVGSGGSVCPGSGVAEGSGDERAITDGTLGVNAKATDSASVQTTKRGLARLVIVLFVRFICGSQCPICSEEWVLVADRERGLPVDCLNPLSI